MRIRNFFLAIILMISTGIVFINNVHSEAYWSGTYGNSTNVQQGSGGWDSSAVGFRVSVYNSSFGLRKSIVISNKAGASYYSTQNVTGFSSKSNRIATTTPTVVSYLPSDYKDGSNFRNWKEEFEKNDYSLLKRIITQTGISLNTSDYIVVEPMIKITSQAYSYSDYSCKKQICYLKKDRDGYYSTIISCKDETTVTLSKLAPKFTRAGTNQITFYRICSEQKHYVNSTSFFITPYEFYNNSTSKAKSYICVNGKYSGFDNCYNNTINSIATALSFKSALNGVSPFTGGGSYPYIDCVKSPTGGCAIGWWQYQNLYPYGSIEITKLGANSSPIKTQSAGFRLYNGQGCIETNKKVDGATNTQTGKVTFGQLETGKWYSFKEIRSPGDNYYRDENNCTNVFVSSAITYPRTVTNYTYCEKELKDRGITQNVAATTPEAKANLVAAYLNLEKNSKGTYRGLLNFSNPTCTALSEATAQKTNTCLNTTITYDKDRFNDNNISGYKEQLNLGEGKTAFCVPDYKLDTSFIQEYNNKTYKLGSIIFQNLENLGTSTINKTCYVYGDTTGIQGMSVSIDYKDYVSDISILNESLNELPGNVSATINDLSSNKFTLTYSLELNKDNYLKKISGLKGNENCFTQGLCNKISGLNTKFNNQTGKVSFVPKVTLGDNYSGITFNESNKCEFNFEPELVTYKDSKYKLNLEFRIINKNNPFPGRTGSGRTIGSNWCMTLLSEGKECTSLRQGTVNYMESETISQEIKDKIITAASSDSTCPKYTIVLDSSTIKKIREYNKGHNYSQYVGKTCDKDRNCISKFFNDDNIKMANDELHFKLHDLNSCTNTEEGYVPKCIPHECGDVNGDCFVDNKDMTRLSQYLSGLQVPIKNELSDVNGDYSIDNKDGIRLSQYTSGWGVTLNCPSPR